MAKGGIKAQLTIDTRDVANFRAGVKRLTTKAVFRDVREEVIKPAADILIAQIQRMAPVDTGLLRDSVGLVADRLRRGTVQMVVKPRMIQGGAKVPREQKSGNHANLIEFGTVNMPAQPFLVPAFALVRSQLRAKMQEDLIDIVNNRWRG